MKIRTLETHKGAAPEGQNRYSAAFRNKLAHLRILHANRNCAGAAPFTAFVKGADFLTPLPEFCEICIA